MPQQPPSADALRTTLEAASAYTVGVEEELMLLDPGTLELVPRAAELMGWLGDAQRFKLELPASQIEIVTPPRRTVREAAADLISGRRELARHAAGRVHLAGAGVSPLGPGSGTVNPSPRYQRTLREFGPIARRQMVCALQVHVSVPGSERALAVYNHARTFLPALAALAANAAYYEGQDTGLASVRPKLSELLPRQGIPPSFESWEQYADALTWGNRSGRIPDPGTWWWELRPHPGLGTLEFRVPDSQATVGDAAAVAGVIHALVVWLARRYDAGEDLPAAATWRLEENRWSACRDGVEGEMADVWSGRRMSTRSWIEELLEALDEVAAELEAGRHLERAARMLEANGAILQRQVAAGGGGAEAVAASLVARFLELPEG